MRHVLTQSLLDCPNSMWNQTLYLGNCWRPYHVECTGSLLTSEVKRHRARLVLGWGTAWEDLRVLTAFYLSTFKPEGNQGCHVNVVILDSGNTPAQHAQCHTTPAARFLEISNISGLFALLFFCNQDLWSWIVARLYHSMLSVILHLLHKFKFSFFVWGHALWPRNPIYTVPMLHCSTEEAYFQQNI